MYRLTADLEGSTYNKDFKRWRRARPIAFFAGLCNGQGQTRESDTKVIEQISFAASRAMLNSKMEVVAEAGRYRGPERYSGIELDGQSVSSHRCSWISTQRTESQQPKLEAETEQWGWIQASSGQLGGGGLGMRETEAAISSRPCEKCRC